MNAQQRQRSRSGAIRGAHGAHSPRPRTPDEANARPSVDYDSFWVRSALSQLEFLVSGRSIGAETKSMVEFAIRWAPFGGASSGDLLVTFGVERRRFLELLAEGLRARRSDDSEQRWLKRRLADALTAAWSVDGGASTGARQC